MAGMPTFMGPQALVYVGGVPFSFSYASVLLVDFNRG
jgi:hypothetical protein